MSVKMYNNSATCVDEALEGLVATNPGLVYLKEQRVVVGRQWLADGTSQVDRCHQVALVTGGGSGHEPFAAGYVGEGFLAAAVAGPVFTSPPPTSIVAAITAVAKDNPAGVLVVVFNYTGDRVNFGLAVEKCKAAGIKVEMYVSGDDSALTEVAGTAGRRGLCGTICLLKILGAMFASGASLEEGMAACHALAGSLGTIGVAASGCQLPGAKEPLFAVAPGVLELGLGVHGEAGAATIKAGCASEIVTTLLDQLTRPDSTTRLDLAKGDLVAVLVNDLGATSQLELAVVRNEVVKQLKSRGVTPIRVYLGPLMTSLDMKGVQISVLRLRDPAWIRHLDAPTTAPAWPTPCLPHGHVPGAAVGELKVEGLVLDLEVEEMLGGDYTLDVDQSEVLRRCVETLCRDVPQHEQLLNGLDTGCGDGDCGTTLLLGIKELSTKLPSLPWQYPSRVLATLADIASSSMGGSSGGLYSILLMTAASHLAHAPTHATPRARWAGALRKGVEAVSKYGGATRGDRTMLDALMPALEALEAAPDTQDLKGLLEDMASMAHRGTLDTATMVARAGRASYVRDGKVNTEDAGARGVTCMLQALANH